MVASSNLATTTDSLHRIASREYIYDTIQFTACINILVASLCTRYPMMRVGISCEHWAPKYLYRGEYYIRIETTIGWWSSGMILVEGTRGRGFESRNCRLVYIYILYSLSYDASSRVQYRNYVRLRAVSERPRVNVSQHPTAKLFTAA